jgi:hypothetical protein
MDRLLPRQRRQHARHEELAAQSRVSEHDQADRRPGAVAVCFMVTSRAPMVRLTGALDNGDRTAASGSCSDIAGAPSSCARSAQLQCTESGGSKRVIGGAYRRTLRGAQRQCQRPGAAFTCRSRGTRLSRAGSAVITTTIGSPASMGRRHATHSNIDILSVVEQHARQIGAHAPADEWAYVPTEPVQSSYGVNPRDSAAIRGFSFQHLDPCFGPERPAL